MSGRLVWGGGGGEGRGRVASATAKKVTANRCRGPGNRRPHSLLSPGRTGVGINASISMPCMQLPEFAVDTHVWEISKALGWVPVNATRDQAYDHMNELVPGEWGGEREEGSGVLTNVLLPPVLPCPTTCGCLPPLSSLQTSLNMTSMCCWCDMASSAPPVPRRAAPSSAARRRQRAVAASTARWQTSRCRRANSRRWRRQGPSRSSAAASRVAKQRMRQQQGQRQMTPGRATNRLPASGARCSLRSLTDWCCLTRCACCLRLLTAQYDPRVPHFPAQLY